MSQETICGRAISEKKVRREALSVSLRIEPVASGDEDDAGGGGGGRRRRRRCRRRGYSVTVHQWTWRTRRRGRRALCRSRDIR